MRNRVAHAFRVFQVAKLFHAYPYVGRNKCTNSITNLVYIFNGVSR
jgi:hypothetical protein